jgi:hypothetical protein
MDDLGVAVIACHRPHLLINCLASLTTQHKNNIHVWLDKSVEEYEKLNMGCKNLVRYVFPYISLHVQPKHLGMHLHMYNHVLPFMATTYKHIIFIEEDVFCTSCMIQQFCVAIESMSDTTFSVYGDDVPEDIFFRSIAWGTTNEKLLSILPTMHKLVSDNEYRKRHIQENLALANRMRRTGDFTWGQMTSYVTYLAGYTHKRTERVCTYHMGTDKFASHPTGVSQEREKCPGRHVDVPYVWGTFIGGQQS